MSDKNLHNRLKELSNKGEILDLSDGISEIDGDLVNSLCTWFRHNAPLEVLKNEIMTPDEIARYKGYSWTALTEGVMDKIQHIIWHEIGHEVISPSGKFNVRLKRCLRVNYGVKSLTQNDYCKLSTIFGDWKESSALKFEFTDVLDWENGDFGDEGSCYWGDRAAARDTLEHYGAHAIRFYKKNLGKTGHNGEDILEGVGRAWIAPITNRKDSDGAVVVFNRYGVPRSMTDVVKAILTLDKDLVSTTVELYNDGECHEILYSNHDAVVISYEPYTKHNLDLGYDIVYGKYDKRYGDGYECEWCGNGIDEDEVYMVNDQTMCERCYNNNAGHCEYCGDSFFNEDLRSLCGGNGLVCERCIRRNDLVECYDCEEYCKVDESRETTDGNSVCPDCADDKYICEDCGRVMEDSNPIPSQMGFFNGIMLTSDVNVCDECHDDHVYECEVCNKEFYDTKIDEREEAICDVCKVCAETK